MIIGLQTRQSSQNSRSIFNNANLTSVVSGMEILLDNVLPAIIPVFLIVLLGYLIGRKTNYDLKFATDITMYFTLPTLIFSALVHK